MIDPGTIDRSDELLDSLEGEPSRNSVASLRSCADDNETRGNRRTAALLRWAARELERKGHK